MRAQLPCLPYYLQASAQASSREPQADDLALHVSYAWAGLSRGCHQHPYQLPPTSVELLGMIAVVEEFVGRVKTVVG